ncbi:MAG: hypothetical protein NTV43_12220 [Methylococcales bacterium]|nr:hypothetical protein [Methylococcales bacterium]
MKILVILACLFYTSGIYAGCVTNLRGKTVCATDQGQSAAAGYNAKTGNAFKAETNQNGVTKTQTSNGGQAITKNGMGVVQAPNGKTCVKTRYSKGCN